MTLFDPPGVAALRLNPTERPRLLSVEVPGKPRGQGSLALWSKDGAEHAKYAPDTVTHRNLVIGELRDAWAERQPIDGPITVRVLAEFCRPAGHYGTGRNRSQLKDSAPAEWFVGFPDGDKIARLVGDALTIAGVIPDDRFIAEWRVLKRWGTRNCTVIEVSAL